MLPAGMSWVSVQWRAQEQGGNLSLETYSLHELSGVSCFQKLCFFLLISLKIDYNNGTYFIA